MNVLALIGRLLKDIFRILLGIGRGSWGTRVGMVFGGLASSVIGGLVVKLLRFFGLTLAVNTFLMPHVLDFITGPLLGLPEDWQSFLAMTRVDHAITITVSAMAIATARRIRMRPAPASIWD